MAWRMLFSRAKNDHVTLNLESKEWQNAFEILRSCDMKQLEYIQSLAGINRTHLSFHVGMSAALYFVTLPAIASFVISRWAAWSAAEDIYGFLLLNIGFGSLLVLKFYTNRWQAMELETCVAYIIAEKKLEDSGYCHWKHAMRLVEMS